MAQRQKREVEIAHRHRRGTSRTAMERCAAAKIHSSLITKENYQIPAETDEGKRAAHEAEPLKKL